MINPVADSDIKTYTVPGWWVNRRNILLLAAVSIMAVASVIWLGYQFWRLLSESPPIWESSPAGAIDLKLRYDEVHKWFSGTFADSAYPPATFVILWPLMGWMSLDASRWLWGLTTVISLAALIYLVVRESLAERPIDRIFVALLPLSMYATGATIGNGQLIVHITPLLIAGILILDQKQSRLSWDLLAAVLLIAALVKPTVSAPFFWIVLFVPGRIRPILLVTIGYAALTLFASSFQEGSPISVIQEWLRMGEKGAALGSISGGYSNLHSWLTPFGLGEWNLAVSLIVLGALGVWVYRNRRTDLWVLIGVSAIVARIWTYHRWFDDLLILLPMVALFRISKQGHYTGGTNVVAGLILAVTVIAMLAPGGLYLLPEPWNTLYSTFQVIVWVVILAYLLSQARRG